MNMVSDIDLNYLDSVLKDLDLEVEGFEEEVRELFEEYKTRKKGGFSDKILICSLVYLVCKKRRMPRGLDEVTEAGGFDVHRKPTTRKERKIARKERKIARMWKKVARALDEPIVPFSIDDWIPRIVSLVNKKTEHNIGMEVEKRAVELKEGVSMEGGGSRRAFATALVYISVFFTDNDKITQSEMADISGSTEVVIRKNYQFIVDALDIREEAEEEVKPPW